MLSWMGVRSYWGSFCLGSCKAGRFGQEKAGRSVWSRNPAAPACAYCCSAASGQLLSATSLTDVIASGSSLETEAFKPQETKNISKLGLFVCSVVLCVCVWWIVLWGFLFWFGYFFVPFASPFFSLEAEKWVWCTLNKMLLDGNPNTSYRTSFWRDESFPNVFGSQG